MKIKTLFFSFTLVLCFVVSGFMFSACGGVSHTYDEVKTSYASMVANNQDFFDKDGYISITYNNDNLVSAISSGETKYNFTKLASSNLNNEAIFEPTLRASLIMPAEFLSSGTIGVEVPKDESTELYNLLEKLKDSFAQLNIAKSQLEIVCDSELFNQQGNLEQLKLKNYCQRFYETINAANNFSTKFASVYSEYIFNSSLLTRPGALAPNTVKLEYLTKLTEFTKFYATFYLYDMNLSIQNSTKEVESITQLSGYLLDQYLDIKPLKTEEDSGPISSGEQAIINAYNDLVDYNSIYYANQKSLYTCIDVLRNIVNTNSMTPEQIVCKAKYDDCIADCENVIRFMDTIKNRILEFNNISV